MEVILSAVAAVFSGLSTGIILMVMKKLDGMNTSIIRNETSIIFIKDRLANIEGKK